MFTEGPRPGPLTRLLFLQVLLGDSSPFPLSQSPGVFPESQPGRMGGSQGFFGDSPSPSIISWHFKNTLTSVSFLPNSAWVARLARPRSSGCTLAALSKMCESSEVLLPGHLLHRASQCVNRGEALHPLSPGDNCGRC